MKYFLNLAWKEIKYYKRQSLSMWLVITITLFLLLETVMVYSSYMEMQLQDAYDNYGYHYVCFKNLSEEQRATLESDEFVSDIGYESAGDYVELTGCITSEQIIKLVVRDEKAEEVCATELLYGRFPENENEISISSAMEVDGDRYYKELKLDGSETLTIKMSGEENVYTIVGVTDDLLASDSGEEFRILTYGEVSGTNRNAYVKTKGADIDEIKNLAIRLGFSEEEITNVGSVDENDSNVIINKIVLNLLNGGASNYEVVKAKKLTAVVVSFVFLAAVLMISGTFSIGLRKRQKDNGILRVCGFSPAMFGTYLLGEIGILLLAALPVGAGLAIVGKELITKLAINARFSVLSRLEIRISLLPILVSFFMVILTVLAAIIVPVINALGNSPLDMISERKQVKKSGRYFFSKLLPEEMKIGFRYASGSKLKSMMVILSLSLSVCMVVIFIACFTIMKDKQQIISDKPGSHFVLFSGPDMDEEAIRESVPYVKSFSVSRSTMIDFEISELDFNSVFDETLADTLIGDVCAFEVSGVDKTKYESLMESSGQDEYPEYEDLLKNETGIISQKNYTVKDGQYVIANTYTNEYPFTLQYSDESAKKGTGEIAIVGEQEMRNLYIGDVQYGYYSPAIFIPIEMYDKYFEASYELISINAEEDKIQQVREWLADNSDKYGYVVTDNAEEYFAKEDTEEMLGTILVAAMIMILTISAINVINTMVANADAVKKDYAVLKALGMNDSAIAQVVGGEILCYVSGAVIISLIFSAIFANPIINNLVTVTMQGKGYVMSQTISVLLVTGAICLVIGLYINRRSLDSGINVNLNSDR